jgi:hypothetical protein
VRLVSTLDQCRVGNNGVEVEVEDSMVVIGAACGSHVLLYLLIEGGRVSERAQNKKNNPRSYFLLLVHP